MMLLELPADIFNILRSYSNIVDILMLRYTCQTLRTVIEVKTGPLLPTLLEYDYGNILDDLLSTYQLSVSELYIIVCSNAIRLLSVIIKRYKYYEIDWFYILAIACESSNLSIITIIYKSILYSEINTIPVNIKILELAITYDRVDVLLWLAESGYIQFAKCQYYTSDLALWYSGYFVAKVQWHLGRQLLRFGCANLP